METALKGDSKSMYSWWWDSHIRPKNSKWLQENLTDMDSKVEQMIKVIEEDADTFSKRAQMYYEKRPELIKLIEELYRAYRALAERYAHATGIISNVHCRLGEVFPSPNLLFSGDGSPVISKINEAYSGTSLIAHPISELVGPGELQIDALGVSSSHFYAIKRNDGFTDEPIGISMTEAEIVALRNSLAELDSNTGLQEKVQKFKKENKNLNELDLSSTALIKSLREEISNLRQTIKKLEEDMEFRLTWMRLHKVLPELEAESGLGLKDENVKDQRVVQDETAEGQSVVHKLMNRLDEMQCIFSEIQDENQCSAFEKSVLVVLLSQLKSEAAVIATEKSILDQEFRIQCQQLSSLRSETQKLVETNQELKSKLNEGGCREELLKAEIENLFREVSKLQSTYRNLQEENQNNMNEKISLTNSIVSLEEYNHKLEDETYLMLSETVYQSCLSLIFKGIIMDKLLEVKMLNEDLGRLHSFTDKQEKKLGEIEGKFKEVQTELFSVKSVNDQLTQEIATEKDVFSHELHKERSEVKLWEIRAASKDKEINQLKGKVMSLEDDKGKLKEQIGKYSQAAVLLNDGFKSLENIVSSSLESEDETPKDSDLVTNLRLDCHPQKDEDEFPDMEDLALRIKAVQEALIDEDKNKFLEKSNADSKLEAMMKQIEFLTSKDGICHMHHEEEDIRNPKQTLKIYEDVREIITKDIMLDQVSDSSISPRIYHTPEFPETSGRNSWFDSELDDQEDKSLSEESLVIEETEIHGSSQQLNGQNVLKSLDADLQTLGNLQITIQELKNKVETNKKLQNKKAVEPDTIKAQLERADDAILNLFDVNQKLAMKIEKGFQDSNDEEKARRRWISVQANRASERIGRLQLEIRRIQQFLMKLDSDRILEGKRRVLLKDYINGGARIKHKIKKRKPLFACLRPKSP